MAKIYDFSKKIKAPVGETLKDFLQKTTIELEEIESAESIVIAIKLKDGSWLTGYSKADWGTRNEALGHIQADIIEQMVKENIDRYLD